MTRTAGRPPRLKRWQVNYIQRAARLRRQLTNVALAKRFGLSTAAIQKYICNMHLHGCREDYDATVVKWRSKRERDRAMGIEQ